MTLKEDPDEEDALDGLANAVRYCNSQGWDDTAEKIASLYQEVGSLTIEDMDEAGEKPMTPADPRPNGKPYYIDSHCQTCGSELVLYDSLSDEKKESSDALGDPETETESSEPWYDEWVCPNCLDGIHMDWPDSMREDDT